jgi:bifunctional N-acetylglucosamine-1-phosphate-uridyltransferase/glucosamine-1-phosphate-acetyltransferase GlmU-like protein
MISALGDGYAIGGDMAIHASATVEAGAVVKGPAILGPRSFVAAGAYLRGGVFLGEDCIVGPSCELKTTMMFGGSKVAHLSFVGDSIIGSGVNIEAGAIVANYRNEMDDKRIRIAWRGGIIDTGVEKFGALIGDHARIGANAVVAPGALIEPGFRLTRLGKLDQHPNRFYRPARRGLSSTRR